MRFASLRTVETVSPCFRECPVIGRGLAFGKIAPYVDFSNLLSARVKGVIAIDKFIYQVVRQVGTIVDDIGLLDREDGIAAATGLRQPGSDGRKSARALAKSQSHFARYPMPPIGR